MEQESFKLSPDHREALLKSGISNEVIDARDYWSADDEQACVAELRRLDLGSFVNRLPGMVIPLFGPNGKERSSQLRLDEVPEQRISTAFHRQLMNAQS